MNDTRLRRLVPDLFTLRRKLWLHRRLASVGLEIEHSSGPLGYGLQRRPKETMGRDPLRDVEMILGDRSRVGCVLDAGAHIGETALSLVDAFPAAMVYSFEPDPDNYAHLTKNVCGERRIQVINAALGRTEGTATLYRNAHDQTHSLLRPADGAEEYLVSPGALRPVDTRRVDVRTLDRFCHERGIDRVDLIKIDSQGFELEILAGAEVLLAQQPPPLLYLEVTFIPYYEGQPLFHDVYRWVYERGYRMVATYESVYKTHFYQVGGNALFVHASIGARVKRIQDVIHA